MRQLHGTKLKRFNKLYKIKDKDIVVFLDNVEYATNVASLFRIADALGASKMMLTGITKTPPFGKELAKVSRSKETKIHWEYIEDSVSAIEAVKKEGYQIVAVELTDESINYKEFSYSDKVCFVIGNEAYGISQKLLDHIDNAVFVPMSGIGRSVNVHVSLAIVAFYVNT